MARIDITNQRFGRLVALYPTKLKDRNRSILWVCLCDCGTHRLASVGQLRYKLSSCGCLQRDAVRTTGRKSAKDISGQVFGRLTAIKRSTKMDGTAVMWDCHCLCGNTCTVRTGHLLSGAVQSCGCYHKEIAVRVNTSHGLSKTREYKYWNNRCRGEIRELYDTSWTLEMEESLRRFFPACVLCGSMDDLEVDHLLPLSLGYGLFTDNAIILCSSCNNHKKNKYIADLPPEVRRKLIDASCEFQDYLEWQMYAEPANV